MPGGDFQWKQTEFSTSWSENAINKNYNKNTWHFLDRFLTIPSTSEFFCALLCVLPKRAQFLCFKKTSASQRNLREIGYQLLKST